MLLDRNKNIDFVKLDRIFHDDKFDKTSIGCEHWVLEVMGEHLGCYISDAVKNPEKWDSADARLLILMQWVNIIAAITSGGNHDNYFNAEDFLRVRQYFMKNSGFENDRLTINTINTHLEWIEKKYKKHFFDDKSYPCEVLDLGRLKKEKITETII